MRLCFAAALVALIFGVQGQRQYRGGFDGASNGHDEGSNFSLFQGESDRELNSSGGSTDLREEGVVLGGSSKQGEVIGEFGGLEDTITGTPGNDYPILSQVPETSFLCDGQAEGGYYADVETECQAFHICTGDGNGGFTKFSFLCPNGTIFQQQYFVCDWWFNVDCSTSEQFYSLNNEIAAERQANSPLGSNGSGNYENESGNVGSARGASHGGRDNDSVKNKSNGIGRSGIRGIGSSAQDNYSRSRGGSSSLNSNSGLTRGSSAIDGASRSKSGSASSQGYQGSQGGSPGQSANAGAPLSVDGIDSNYGSPSSTGSSRGSSFEDQSSLGSSRRSNGQQENNGIVSSYESQPSAGSFRGSSKGSARGSFGSRGSIGYDSPGVSQREGFTTEGKAGKTKSKSGSSKGRKKSSGNNRSFNRNRYSAPKSPRGRGGAQENDSSQGESAEDSYGAPLSSVIGVGEEALGGPGNNYGSVGNGDDALAFNDNDGVSESADLSFGAPGDSIDENNGIFAVYNDLQNVYSRSEREF